MKSILLGVIVSAMVALIFVLIERHYKKKFRDFAQATNKTITSMWSKWVQIETLYGTCQVNYTKENSKSGNAEHWCFDFIGVDELCKLLSKYEGEYTVNIYPKNTKQWTTGMIELEGRLSVSSL